MQRVQIYIDASNLYHMILKRIGCREIDFDYDKFAATDKHEAVRPVKTMIYNTDVQRVLSEADMRQFIKPKLL